jgi:hypothetical protein
MINPLGVSAKIETAEGLGEDSEGTLRETSQEKARLAQKAGPYLV